MIVMGLDQHRAQISAELVHDRHQGLAEPFEGLPRVPHVEYLDGTVLTHPREVVGTSGRRARTGLLEATHRLVVPLLGVRLRFEVETERHWPPFQLDVGEPYWQTNVLPPRVSRR